MIYGSWKVQWKVIANQISRKYKQGSVYLYTHEEPNYFKPLKIVDNQLYRLGLSNLIDVVLIILMLLLIYYCFNKFI
jgi:hypothetical protein